MGRTLLILYNWFSIKINISLYINRKSLGYVTDKITDKFVLDSSVFYMLENGQVVEINDELGFVIVKGDKHNMNHDDEAISI